MKRREPPGLPAFYEFLDELPDRIGANTRAIVSAIVWAGERIARAVVDQRETHSVREMSEELGQAFIKASVRPPPPPKK